MPSPSQTSEDVVHLRRVKKNINITENKYQKEKLFTVSHLTSLVVPLGGLALPANGFSSCFDEDRDFEEEDEEAAFGALDESVGGFEDERDEDDFVGGGLDENDFDAGGLEDDAGVVLDVDAGALDVDAGALDDGDFDVDEDDFDVDDDDFVALDEGLAPEDDFDEDDEALGAPGAGLVLEVEEGALVPGAGLEEGFGLVLSEPPGFGTLSLSFISIFSSDPSHSLGL